MDPKSTSMKKDILKTLLLCLVITVIGSCSEESELKQTCVLQKVSIAEPDNYQLIEYNANGTIASVKIIFNEMESQRFDYVYASDKISIYLTDLGASHELTCEIGLDAQGRPVSRTENHIVYERYVYSNDRLDHIMWSGNDSITFSYSGTNKNPDSSDFYDYNEDDQTWTKWSTTTFTFDEHPNPLKGLILPLETNWNIGVCFHENNRTSYSSDGDTWNLAYTYNAAGYPVSRTLTSSSQSFTETKDFTYDCH